MSRPTAQAEQQVSPDRLAAGDWDHAAGKQFGEGDMHAAYSADTIAIHGHVRAPFRFQGAFWVTVSIGHQPSVRIEAYRLVPEQAFCEPARSYSEKVREGGGEPARNDPRGFYHSMRVTWAQRPFVLSGPPVTFLPGAPEPTQCDLFAGGAS